MMHYLLYFVFSIFMQLIAWVVTPTLPLFRKDRWGWSNNGNMRSLGPRLPLWLSWLDTPDNSLLGDSRWRAEHSGGYWSMVGNFLMQIKLVRAGL